MLFEIQFKLYSALRKQQKIRKKYCKLKEISYYSLFFYRFIDNNLHIEKYIYIHDTQNAHMSQEQNGLNMHVIMKTMCPPDLHHNSFLPIYALINIYTFPGTVESYRHIYK